MNAFIPMGIMQQFRCASHNGASLHWSVRIGNQEETESDREFLMNNGVTWEPNPSTGSSRITIFLDSEVGSAVTGIGCRITLIDGQDIRQRCFIYVSIHVYGEYIMYIRSYGNFLAIKGSI